MLKNCHYFNFYYFCVSVKTLQFYSPAMVSNLSLHGVGFSLVMASQKAMHLTDKSIYLLPTAYVVREEVIFSVCLSVHISVGGGGTYLPDGGRGGTYSGLDGGGGGGTYSGLDGGVPTLRSGWGGGVPTFPGLDGGGYLPR